MKSGVARHLKAMQRGKILGEFGPFSLKKRGARCLCKFTIFTYKDGTRSNDLTNFSHLSKRKLTQMMYHLKYWGARDSKANNVT